MTADKGTSVKWTGALRFRKRPVVVEAARLDPNLEIGQWDRVVEWVNVNGGQAIMVGSPGRLLVYIDTLEGRMTAEAGDWVIRGVKGEFYPCKPDIFDATYELAP